MDAIRWKFRESMRQDLALLCACRFRQADWQNDDARRKAGRLSNQLIRYDQSMPKF